MSLRHDDGNDTPKPSGIHIILNGDGVSMAPTPRKKDPRYTFEKSFAPGKVASESDIRKSKTPVGPHDPNYDPLDPAHAPRSAAARNSMTRTSSLTVHAIGDGPVAQIKHGDVVHFVHNETLHHGRVAGLSPTHALVDTPEGSFTIPRSRLSPGFHPGVERPAKGAR